MSLQGFTDVTTGKYARHCRLIRTSLQVNTDVTATYTEPCGGVSLVNARMLQRSKFRFFFILGFMSLCACVCVCISLACPFLSTFVSTVSVGFYQFLLVY